MSCGRVARDLHRRAGHDLVPRPMNCLGVPIIYDHDLKMRSITLCSERWWWPWKFSEPMPCIVETRGLFRWKYIRTGRLLYAFSSREKQAILLHEVGHVKLNHVERRLLKFWQILLMPVSFSKLCIAQEFQADYYAAECGYALDLANALSRMNSDGTASMHPQVSERIARLLAWRSKE